MQLWTRPLILAAAVLLLAGVARADSLELENGDVVSGKILSVDDQRVKLKSEALGELTIPRAKVRAIHFGDRRPPRNAPAAANQPQPGSADALLRRVLRGAGARVPARKGDGDSVDDVVEQLQQDGVDPQALEQMQKQFPLLAMPQARNYFQQSLGGLATGKTSIQDVRKDAIKARAVILDLKQELGPGASALDGYLAILNQFIAETDPARNDAAKNKGRPAPGNATPREQRPRFPRPDRR